MTDVETELRKMVTALAKPAPDASKVCELAADIVADSGRLQMQLAVWKHNLEVLLEKLDGTTIPEVREYIQGMLTICK